MNSTEEEMVMPGARDYQILWRAGEVWRHGQRFHTYKGAAEYGRERYGYGMWMVEHRSMGYKYPREEQLLMEPVKEEKPPPTEQKIERKRARATQQAYERRNGRVW